MIFPDIAKESRFTIDDTGCYLANTVYFIATDELYLLGVLNSRSVWDYCKENLTVLGDAEKGGRLRFFRQFVERIPVPNATARDKKAIGDLVSECLNLRGEECSNLEKRLNVKIANLYGIDPT